MHMDSSIGEWSTVMTWQFAHCRAAAASVAYEEKVVVIHNEYKGCPGSHKACLHADKK